MSHYLYFVFIIVLIGLAAFIAAAEMAYSSANRLRLEAAAENGSKRAAVASYICLRFEDALGVLLITGNLLEISISSLATVAAIVIAGERFAPAATAAVTILSIVFGETVPKIVAKKNANRFALSAAYVIRVLMFIFKPVVFVAVSLVRLVTGPFASVKAAGEGDEEAVDELVTLIETGEDEGVIDEDRSELLQAALGFSETSASEVMTSRVDVTVIEIDAPWTEIMAVVDGSSHSRIPVYEGSFDNIIGILYINRLFRAMIDNRTPDLRELLIPPCYVYKTIKLPDVLAELRRRKTHIAVVTDEYGGSMGIITMEDVLEELVGDIWDETDEISTDIVERGEKLYEVDGDLSIYELIEFLELDEDCFDTESSTVGGWTLERFGGFPEEGESFNFLNLSVTVLRRDGLRVEKVLIEVKLPADGAF